MTSSLSSLATNIAQLLTRLTPLEKSWMEVWIYIFFQIVCITITITITIIIIIIIITIIIIIPIIIIIIIIIIIVVVFVIIIIIIIIRRTGSVRLLLSRGQRVSLMDCTNIIVLSRPKAVQRKTLSKELFINLYLALGKYFMMLINSISTDYIIQRSMKRNTKNVYLFKLAL